MNMKTLAQTTALLLLAAHSAFAAETYKLDPAHTAVTWHISHFGFSHPSGKFMDVDGTLTLDEANPANSKIAVTIPVDKINTGVAKLDEHLKSKDFFETDRFPTATFTSTKVTPTGDNTATVAGNLTLHGITQPVTLDVTLNKLGTNMFNKKTAGFTAGTTIKRSDFGITTYLPGLGDDIRIDIESEANLAE